MCGIAGIVRFDDVPVDAGEFDRMLDALEHRGPDGRGTFIDKNIALGQRRLKIIDLSEAAAQPMYSEDRNTILVFNGEIYNFQGLRRGLEARGHRFRSTGDTEVLLKLYEEEGSACLQRLRGMFAFAIFDKKRQQLFLARDRLGKKPLKYFYQHGVFAFASELKALQTLAQCPRKVDREALHHFLTLMYLPSPLTGFTGIKKLPAAHSLTIDLRTGEERLERYWALRRTSDNTRSIDTWKQQILATLEESVKLRMIADVPLGAFLSGGLDSSTIVALMARNSSSPVKTFTIGSDDPQFDERSDAALTAKMFGTEHTEIPLEADIVKLLPELVAAYEEPFADPSSIPTYLVSRATRKHVTVALNGDGGDENFAGYVRYPILLFSEKWSHMPHPFHVLVRGMTSALHRPLGTTFTYRLNRFAQSLEQPWEERFLQYFSFFTEDEEQSLYGTSGLPLPEGGARGGGSCTGVWYAAHTADARSRADTLLHKAMTMEQETYLADCLLPKVDLGAMAHGLEARSPFLDHVLLELTCQLPDHLQLRGRTGKWIFRQIIGDLLPPELLKRKKRGFRLPLDTWFRGELQEWVHERIMDSPPMFWEMFDRSAVEAFLKNYFSSRVNYSDHVWTMLWLGEWMALSSLSRREGAWGRG